MRNVFSSVCLLALGHRRSTEAVSSVTLLIGPVQLYLGLSPSHLPSKGTLSRGGIETPPDETKLLGAENKAVSLCITT